MKTIFNLLKNKYVLVLILGGTTLLTIVFVKIINERWAMYPYSVEKSYHYEFHTTDSLKVNIQDGHFTVPDEIGKNHSVFLGVSVNTSLTGKFFQPSVKISSGGKIYIDYFEHGAKGKRYINISSLTQAGMKEITLKGRRISFNESDAFLFIFKQPSLVNSKILVVSPHPDDAEIAAFGLYSKYPDSTFILTITAGEEGEFNYDELYAEEKAHFRKKGEVRTWNSVTVPLLGGIKYENTLNLGFFDGTLLEMYQNNGKSVFSSTLKTDDITIFRKHNLSGLKDSLAGGSDWHSLVANLKMVLRQFKPNVIVAPHPLLDSHTDHQVSAIAIMQAMKELQIKEGQFLFYSNHYYLNEFVPYGKTGGVVSLPPLFEKRITVDGFYSMDMNLDQQAGKILALDAMNDLRPDTEWRFWKPALNHFYQNAKVALFGNGNTYFKRAVRSNELFLVISVEKIYDENFWMTIIGDYSLD